MSHEGKVISWCTFMKHLVMPEHRGGEKEAAAAEEEEEKEEEEAAVHGGEEVNIWRNFTSHCARCQLSSLPLTTCEFD